VQDFHTSRAFARNSGQARADCGFITTTNWRYIDIICSNPAAFAYSLRGIRDPHVRRPSLHSRPGYPGYFRSARRTNGPILGDLVDDPQHLAIFLVQATGRLSDPAIMDLIKFIVKDSPSRSILNTFYSQIGGSIARYNAMVAHAWWVQNYSRSSHISVGEVAG
jgi:hypothetical protein